MFKIIIMQQTMIDDIPQNSSKKCKTAASGVANATYKQNVLDGNKHEGLGWNLWQFAHFRWARHFIYLLFSLFAINCTIIAYIAYTQVLLPLCIVRGKSGKLLYRQIEQRLYGWALEIMASWTYAQCYKMVEIDVVAT